MDNHEPWFQPWITCLTMIYYEWTWLTKVHMINHGYPWYPSLGWPAARAASQGGWGGNTEGGAPCKPDVGPIPAPFFNFFVLSFDNAHDSSTTTMEREEERKNKRKNKEIKKRCRNRAHIWFARGSTLRVTPSSTLARGPGRGPPERRVSWIPMIDHVNLG